MDYTQDEIDILSNCTICPRRCGANRFERKGVCGAGVEIEVASVNIHTGEEPPISGFSGSGTIFMTHCNLNCVYCQNYPLSQQNVGKVFSMNEFTKAMISLQERGAHNINFVAPSHYTVQIRRGIIIAREMGLTIPIVYNTSGYDSPEALELLDGYIDIYMPDLRYWESEMARKYSNAADYPEVSRQAVKIMKSQVGDLDLDDDGIAKKGILIRLLVLPENVSETIKSLKWIAENLGTNTFVSVMSQYFPAYKAEQNPPLHRKPNADEYTAVLDAVEELGFENGYIQPIPE